MGRQAGLYYWIDESARDRTPRWWIEGGIETRTGMHPPGWPPAPPECRHCHETSMPNGEGPLFAFHHDQSLEHETLYECRRCLSYVRVAGKGKGCDA